MKDEPSRFDGKALRAIMRNVPSPVTVVTGTVRGSRKGITIGSFTSVSLDPPMVTFNVAQDTPLKDFLAESGVVAVHVLAADQKDISDRFAEPDLTGTEQFAGISWQENEHGLAMIDGVIATLIARIEDVHEAGDHSIFVARVLSGSERRSSPPLVYYNRTYRSIDGERTKRSSQVSS